ncbi:MAG TPA: peptidylprolyl isomerase, partial [Cytophagales bacterium]|nr:peptidylprolyl isomerase [Cytophagales bacterium]
MKKVIFSFIGLSIVMACKSTKTTTSAAQTTKSTATTSQPIQDNGPYIIKVGQRRISPAEFKYVYNKNNSNNDSAYTLKNINEYLDLYTNFRLKVAEAESLGYDTLTSFKKELEGYKKQLAQPYLKEKGVTERLIKEAYERMKEDVDASHILLRVAEDAEPKDTLDAYNKIVALRARALKGEDFGKLAEQYSQDPSAKENKGRLNYFTALQMVYPFEDAAYKTKVGEISMPVRTKFGYHIIKVNGRRASQGTVTVAHIWARFTEEQEASDSIEAVKKINEIYKRLQKGEKWDELASQFSDDTRSSKTGGVLTEFGVAQMTPKFEEAAFSLKKPGEYTKPVRTPYGYHIIKLIEKKPIAPFETLENSIKAKVSKDSRSDLNKVEFLKRIKKENNFVENTDGVNLAFSKADSNLTKGNWTFDDKAANLNTTLFTINGKVYTVKDFLTHLKAKQRARTHSPRYIIEEAYKEYVENALVTYEESHLETKYEDYKMLVREYRDGILLFQIMDENVWNKAVQDTAGQRQFFEKNKSNYKWGERVDATVFNCANKDILAKVKEYLRSPVYPLNEDKPAPVNFEKDADTLDNRSKAFLEQSINQMIRDKHLTAEIQLASLKSEDKALGAKRVAEIKKMFDSKKVASNRYNIVDNGNILASEKAYFGIKLYSSSKNTIEKLLNVTNALNVKVADGKFQKGDNEFIDATPRAKGEYTLNKSDRIQYIIIRDVEAPRNKYFEECKGSVISDYQNYLEKEWIAKLKQKYTVDIS